MHITTVPESTNILQQMAEIPVAGFRPHCNAWETTAEALEEIHMVLGKGFARVALADDGNTVLRWIGSLPEYDGNVWELSRVKPHKPHFVSRHRPHGRCAVLPHDPQFVCRHRLHRVLVIAGVQTP